MGYIFNSMNFIWRANLIISLMINSLSIKSLCTKLERKGNNLCSHFTSYNSWSYGHITAAVVENIIPLFIYFLVTILYHERGQHNENHFKPSRPRLCFTANIKVSYHLHAQLRNQEWEIAHRILDTYMYNFYCLKHWPIILDFLASAELQFLSLWLVRLTRLWCCFMKDFCLMNRRSRWS